MYFLSYSCCLGGGPSIELILYPGKPSMSLRGIKKYVCDPESFPLPTGRGSVRPGGVSHVKASIRERLN